MRPTSDHVIALLAMLAEQSGEKVSEQRLEFTSERLRQYDVEQVCRALMRMVETARRFPTVGEIKAAMGVAEPTGQDEARMIAEAIMTGIRKFGYVDAGNKKTPQAIRLAIGEAAWDLVTSVGGWNAVIERATENEMACRAQLRDLAEANLKSGGIKRGGLPGRPMSASEAIQSVQRSGELAEERRAGMHIVSGPTAGNVIQLPAPKPVQVPQKSLAERREEEERQRIAEDCRLAGDYFASRVRGFSGDAERQRWRDAYFDARYTAAAVKARIDQVLQFGLVSEISCASDLLTAVFNQRFALKIAKAQFGAAQ